MYSNKNQTCDNQKGSSSSFLLKLDKKHLVGIQMTISRNVEGPSYSGSLKRSLEEPEKLKIHKCDKITKPIFTRSDIMVNKYIIANTSDEKENRDCNNSQTASKSRKSRSISPFTNYTRACPNNSKEMTSSKSEFKDRRYDERRNYSKSPKRSIHYRRSRSHSPKYNHRRKSSSPSRSPSPKYKSRSKNSPRREESPKYKNRSRHSSRREASPKYKSRSQHSPRREASLKYKTRSQYSPRREASPKYKSCSKYSPRTPSPKYQKRSNHESRSETRRNILRSPSKERARKNFVRNKPTCDEKRLKNETFQENYPVDYGYYFPAPMPHFGRGMHPPAMMLRNFMMPYPGYGMPPRPYMQVPVNYYPQCRPKFTPRYRSNSHQNFKVNQTPNKSAESETGNVTCADSTVHNKL